MGGALLTGSRRYGTPKDDSDYDIVILVSSEEYIILYEGLYIQQGTEVENLEDYNNASDSMVMRFGPINLIVTHCPVRFAVWEKGTQELVGDPRAKVSRDFAVEVIRGLRVRHGVAGRLDEKDVEAKFTGEGKL